MSEEANSAPEAASPSLSAVMGVGVAAAADEAIAHEAAASATAPAEPPIAPTEEAAEEETEDAPAVVAAPAEAAVAETPAEVAEEPAKVAAFDYNSFQALVNPPPPNDDGPSLVSMGMVRSRAELLPADDGAGLGEGPALTDTERHVLLNVRAKGGEEIEEMSNELITRCLRGYAGYKDRIGDTTEAMLKIIRWRREMGMHEILGKKLEHHDAFNENWQCMLCGEDSDGHLIQYESLSTINTVAMSAGIENGTVPLDALMKQRAQVMEAVDEYKKTTLRKKGARRHEHTRATKQGRLHFRS